MICAEKAEAAPAVGDALLSPALKASQPELKSIVGKAFSPFGAKKSRTRLPCSLRPQRFCLILFIFPLFGLLCSAATEAHDRTFGDAADTLTPEGKTFEAQSPASANEGCGKAISPPMGGMTQATGDLQVDSSLSGAPGEADSELSRAMQQQTLRERVFDVLVCAFLINLGLVLGFLAVILLFRLAKAELARWNARLARNPAPRLIIVQCMLPHPHTFSDSSCSLYEAGVEPVNTSTACSTPCISSCPSRSRVAV